MKVGDRAKDVEKGGYTHAALKQKVDAWRMLALARRSAVRRHARKLGRIGRHASVWRCACCPRAGKPARQYQRTKLKQTNDVVGISLSLEWNISDESATNRQRRQFVLPLKAPLSLSFRAIFFVTSGERRIPRPPPRPRPDVHRPNGHHARVRTLKLAGPSESWRLPRPKHLDDRRGITELPSLSILRKDFALMACLNGIIISLSSHPLQEVRGVSGVRWVPSSHPSPLQRKLCRSTERRQRTCGPYPPSLRLCSHARGCQRRTSVHKSRC